MSYDPDFSGQHVVVMGLGLHGGGLESARFLAERGADCLVTDLRDETILKPSLERLADLPIRYRLGRHEIADFKQADLVVKNPAVRPDSPFLAAARHIETDISLFLRYCPARICAVTGSKGKSTVASAIFWALQQAGRRSFLGGNISLSPLSFVDAIQSTDQVVLELSSWQLGDLRGITQPDGRSLLKAQTAVITNILPDHLDRYSDMTSYVADKRLIYAGQTAEDLLIVRDDYWGQSFAADSQAAVAFFSQQPLTAGRSGGWLSPAESAGHDQNSLVGISPDPTGRPSCLVPSHLLTLGHHQKLNLLAAALALRNLDLSDKLIRTAMASFPGIEHRLEFFHEAGGVRYYNDSAATIPEATAAAVVSFAQPPILVTGGTDKNLDFSPLLPVIATAKVVILLAGSASSKLVPLLKTAQIRYIGPYDQLEEAVQTAINSAQAGDSVVLSPGCASFEMFNNEFDRGRQWKAAVRKWAPA